MCGEGHQVLAYFIRFAVVMKRVLHYSMRGNITSHTRQNSNCVIPSMFWTIYDELLRDSRRHYDIQNSLNITNTICSR